MEALILQLMPALAALGIGLLVGVEREYGQRPREDGHVKHIEAAGIRTFALVALSGNLLTWLPQNLLAWGVALGLAFIAAMAVVSYRRTSQGPAADVGITSEIVLVLTYVLGVLTGLGYVLPATIMAVIVFSLLQLKKVLHRFSYSLSKMDLRQAMQFLIITVVVLPILPDMAIGPYQAVNPQQVWLMVVLISAIGFAAYAAIKLLGRRAGLGVTGILGGLASSTAVTLAMSRLSRVSPELQGTCAISIILACATMFPRVAALTLLFSPQIIVHLLLPVTVVIAVSLGLATYLWRKEGLSVDEAGHYQPEINPLSLPVALGFGAFYAVVVFFSHLAQAEYGQGGVLGVAGLSGLSDVDAITLSLGNMVADAHLSPPAAAQAILLACASNSLVKMGMGMIFAAPEMRLWLGAGLLSMTLISLIGMGWL